MEKLHSKIKFGLAIFAVFAFRLPDRKHVLLFIDCLESDPTFTDVSGKVLVFSGYELE